MPSPYLSCQDYQFITGGTKYIYDAQVEHDSVLLITSITLYSSAIAQNDTLQIGIERSGNKMLLHSVKLPANVEALTYNCLIPIRDGERVYGYFVDIATTEAVTLTVCGVLMTVEEFARVFGKAVPLAVQGD